MSERLTDEQLRLLIRISPDEYEVEAATEILALRARNAQLEEALKTGWGDKVDALRARVAQLEAALLVDGAKLLARNAKLEGLLREHSSGESGFDLEARTRAALKDAPQ